MEIQGFHLPPIEFTKKSCLYYLDDFTKTYFTWEPLISYYDTDITRAYTLVGFPYPDSHHMD